MSDHKDGSVGPQITPEQLAQTNALIAQLDQPVRLVVHAMLAGLIHTFPQIPAHAVLTMAAMQTGLFLGTAMTGELGTLLQIRKGFKEAFAEGISKVPPNVRQMGPVPTNLRGS